MYALELENPDAITLYVSDVERSRRFYQELLGLAMESEDQELEPPPSGAGPGVSDLRLELRRQEVDGAAPHSLWLSVEVDTVTDVLDLYLLAIILGSRAILPRKRGERWSTVVTDPDGHRVSIWTHVPREAPGREAGVTHARRSPRLDWDMAHRRGSDAGEHPHNGHTQHDDHPAWISGRGAGGAEFERLNPSAGRDITPAN